MNKPAPDRHAPEPTITGCVFDIRRGSFNDGPGIRTTVFMKGCPLRCVWCHNPESQSITPQLEYDATKCLGCRACAMACANEVHLFGQDGRHAVSFVRCNASGNCAAACPGAALKIAGSHMGVDEVMQSVRSDLAYYRTSGGGLTLSGGEPTAQRAFAIALLRAAKAEGVHTCVETCGQAPVEIFEQLLQLTDLFLYDYKATGSDRHRELTGVPSGRILANLLWLHDHGAEIVLRCPLIPGVNDTDEHLRGIADLSRALPRLRGVELLPYHEGGSAKHLRIGATAPVFHAHTPDAAYKRAWIDTLTTLGCVGLQPLAL